MATTRTITLEELGVVLGELASKAPEAIMAACRAHAMDVLRTVVADHMTGQDLGVVTGTARRSMTWEVVPTENSIKIVWGSPLNYVRAHEEGFEGDVTVRAHVRRILGRSEALTRSGKRSRARITKAFANVRSHDRHIKIRAKRFLRKSINERAPQLPKRVKRALILLIDRGRVPTTAEVISG